MKRILLLSVAVSAVSGLNPAAAYDDWHFYMGAGDGLIDTQNGDYYMATGGGGYVNMDQNEVYMPAGGGSSINFTTGETYLGSQEGAVNMNDGDVHFTPSY